LTIKFLTKIKVTHSLEKMCVRPDEYNEDAVRYVLLCLLTTMQHTITAGVNSVKMHHYTGVAT